MPEKKTKVKLGLKNLAMLPSYFDYIFVHQKQKVRLRPELSPKFLSTLGSHPAWLTTLGRGRRNMIAFYMNYHTAFSY